MVERPRDELWIKKVNDKDIPAIGATPTGKKEIKRNRRLKVLWRKKEN